MSQRPETLLRFRDVKARVGLSKSSLYHLIRKREFPAPVGLGVRAVAWRESAVEEWIAERVKQAQAA